MNSQLAVSAALLCAQVISSSAVDSDAITFLPPAGTTTNLAGGQVVGYYNGGVGWSFVPNTNIIVTQIGYKNDYGSANVAGLRIAFWDSAKKTVASYTLGDSFNAQETDTNRITYGSITPLLLQAGQEYFITSDVPGNAQVVESFSSDLSNTDIPHFATAAEIAYGGLFDFDPASGELLSHDISNAVILGPTFRYQKASAFEPRLSVVFLGNAVVLSWPERSATFTLESATSVEGPTWQQIAEVPVLVNDRYSVTYHPPDSNPRFFRLRMQ